MIKALDPSQLFRRCDLNALDFRTTDDLEDFEGLLGQPRAVAAVEFGIGIEREGYNIFAFGPPGTGKHTAVRQYLQARARSRPIPPDLCYVNNFDKPHCPCLLELPAGRGQELRKAMERLVEEIATALESALESEEYQTRRQVLQQEVDERQSKALAELGEEAGQEGLALVRTPVGVIFAPLQGDQVLSPEDYEQLPEKERQKVEQEIERLKEKLQRLLLQFPRWQRATREKVRELNLEVSRFALRPLIDELREQFVELPDVLAYLDKVEADIVASAGQFEAGEAEDPVKQAVQAIAGGGTDRLQLRRYRVNVLVDHGQSEGAPVVYENNPSYQSLVGRVEHIPRMGAVVTDFNLIMPGALHRANGGYLLVDALRLLRQPYAWDGLKRALQAREIKIESLSEALSLVSAYSLEPEPAELDIKLVLLGEPLVYYLLSTHDPDFGELFKVAADFGERLEWNGETQQMYARLLAKLVRERELRPFERSALARVIEHGARTVGDAERMSLYMGRVVDLLQESDYWAGKAKRDTVLAADVQRAIDAQIFRADRLRERTQEEILRRSLLLDTDGEKVGQINALSVLQLGDFAFGRPSRITARVRLGKGEVIDIEREVELSGPLHSKGVLILAGFLGARYAADRPLSLAASLVFEQSYGGVDGDSASSAELYALLSGISGVPLKQSLAVTGSVNQHGEVQAIGGVNEKIEGFFDVCRNRGLTGKQGVLIPSSNVKNLMLRRDVVEAVEAGRFEVFPVETVDQGIELLTGRPAGVADEQGEYPEGSINFIVGRRLEDLARTARAFASPAALTDA